MKTKELIKKVKELGFEIIRAGSHIDIIFNDFIVAGVYTDQMYVMSFYHYDEKYLINEDKLFNLIVKYTSTPIDDREEEKKYMLRHKWITDSDFYTYLVPYKFLGGKKYTLSCYRSFTQSSMEFTKKEIEEIKEKYNTDLADFEMVEV